MCTGGKVGSRESRENERLMELNKVNGEKVASVTQIFNRYLLGPGDTHVNKINAAQASGWAQWSFFFFFLIILIHFLFIFEVFIEFITILLLFYVLIFLALEHVGS